MNLKIITEGKARIEVFEQKIVSKDMEVFYNPVMKFNRDTCVSLLNSLEKENMQIADPMAGSGVRAVRLVKELKENKIKSLSINDLSEKSISMINKNLELNDIGKDNIMISQKDANIFMLDSQGFDYIDIDPFGSPNQFLDSAMERISRKGVLGITATDTAPLAGTYPSTCKRKYWATPIRNEHMHEIGLRILIRKIQLIAMQYEKALTPVFSYYKDHYFRTYLICEKSKTKADEIIKNHQYFHYCTRCMNHKTSKNNQESCCEKKMDTAGPLFIASINDSKLLASIASENEIKENNDFYSTLLEESKTNMIGFIDLHIFSKKYSRQIPKTELVLKRLKDAGFIARKTHFDMYGIKTDASIKEFAALFS